MKIQNIILFSGIVIIFLIIERIGGRALPDFYTDEDLNSWHKFGLRSFYGPWSVIARKPNGDFITYADYGSTIPSGFHLISTDTIDDQSSSGNNYFDRETSSEGEYDGKYPIGLSDFAAGYEMSPDNLESFANGIKKNRDSTLHDSLDKNDETEHLENLSVEKNDGMDRHDKRDTLELIGIVGVVSETDDDSLDDDTTTSLSTTIDGDDDDDDTSVSTTIDGDDDTTTSVSTTIDGDDNTQTIATDLSTNFTS